MFCSNANIYNTNIELWKTANIKTGKTTYSHEETIKYILEWIYIKWEHKNDNESDFITMINRIKNNIIKLVYFFPYLITI